MADTGPVVEMTISKTGQTRFADREKVDQQVSEPADRFG